LAGLRSGLIGMSCGGCRDTLQEGETDGYVQKSFGCNEPLQVPATWFGEEEQFFNCPMKFITSGCVDFLEKYDSYKKGFATPPDYEKQAAKFWEGVRSFESNMNKCMAMKKGE
jgi:hypothetical protein